MQRLTRRISAWAVAVGTVLLIPAVAMHATREVNWTRSDFVIAGALLFAAALAYELLAWKLPRHRVAVGVALALLVGWLWVELAVGLFTDWGS